MPPATTRQLGVRTEWTKTMRRTVDNSDYEFRVYEVAGLVTALQRGSGESGEMAAAITDWAPSARYYVRYTRGGGVHAVGIVDHPNGGTRVYYGRAGGAGYDKVAAALSGMPLPGRHGWYLTDHSAMREGEGYPGPYGGERRAVMVHRGGYLPAHLVLK